MRSVYGLIHGCTINEPRKALLGPRPHTHSFSNPLGEIGGHLTGVRDTLLLSRKATVEHQTDVVNDLLSLTSNPVDSIQKHMISPISVLWKIQGFPQRLRDHSDTVTQALHSALPWTY